MTTNLRRFPDLPSTLPRNLEFILGLSPSAMTLGLGNIRSLLARLGHPEREFRSIVVAGTNGKGSVTAMLASILSSHGLRVGRFISPHVYSVTERVGVDGAPATVEEMEEAAARIAPLRDETPFSYFEALTAIAYLVFAKRGVEIAVLETGLGGRFDATNTVNPELSIITSISLDHRRILGDSEEEILREKLGITRRGVPLLIGELSAHLVHCVRERSERDGFPVVSLSELGTATETFARNGDTRARVVTPLADYGEVTLPFPGAHQLVNTLLAVGAAERVVGRVGDLSAGLERAYLPGRFETVEEAGKTFVLDVAHNDSALSAAVGMLGRTWPREETALVLGLMRRKELFDFPKGVHTVASRLYLISPGGADAFTPSELLDKLSGNGLKKSEMDVILWDRRDDGDDHWQRLLNHLRGPQCPHRRVLVAGSHHVVENFGKRLFSRNVTA